MGDALRVVLAFGVHAVGAAAVVEAVRADVAPWALSRGNDRIGYGHLVFALAAGQRLGPYVLEAPIGRGASGEVWRARHEVTSAPVALKVLLDPLDPQALLRFQRESLALARVGGEALVPIHGFGVERGRPWLALGLCEGGSLRERRRLLPRASPDEAVALVLPLCRALGRCHAAGLVHRDVKPENIIFDPEGRPYLTDFGLVRDLLEPGLTASGVVMGTPAYMAPEQLEGRPAGPSADVFALGAVLHELLAGAPPFSGGGGLSAQLTARARGPAALPGHVPGGLCAVVARALSADPARRYPDATALGAALAGCLAPSRSVATRDVVLIFGCLALGGIWAWQGSAGDRGGPGDPGHLARLAELEALVAPARLGLPAPPLPPRALSDVRAALGPAPSGPVTVLLGLATAEDALARGDAASVESALLGLEDARAELARSAALPDGEAIPRLAALSGGEASSEAAFALARRALLRGDDPGRVPDRVPEGAGTIALALGLARAGRLDPEARRALARLRERDPRLAAATGGALLARAALEARSPVRAPRALAALDVDDPTAVATPAAARVARTSLEALNELLEERIFGRDPAGDLALSGAAALAFELCARSDDDLAPPARAEHGLHAVLHMGTPDAAMVAEALVGLARLGVPPSKLGLDPGEVLAELGERAAGWPGVVVSAEVERWHAPDDGLRRELVARLTELVSSPLPAGRARAHVLLLAGELAFLVGDQEGAYPLLERALAGGCSEPDRAAELLTCSLARLGRLEEARLAGDRAEAIYQARLAESSPGSTRPSRPFAASLGLKAQKRRRLPILRGQILAALGDGPGLADLAQAQERDPRGSGVRPALRALQAFVAIDDAECARLARSSAVAADALREVEPMLRASGREAEARRAHVLAGGALR